MHLSTREIKKLLQKWHFYKAYTSSSGADELTRKITAVEKAITSLDDVDKTIIRLKYFQRLEVDMIQSQVFLSRSVVYWRIDKAIGEIAYLVANMA